MSRTARLKHGVLFLGALALAGCGSSSAPKPSGILAITINEPNGATPSVNISGPKSYSKSISSTTTLTGLVAGNYTIVADSAMGPDSIVGTVIDTGSVSGSPAAVVSHDTVHVTITYANKRRIGGVWIAPNDPVSTAEFSTKGLYATDTLVAGDTIGGLPGSPAGVALDASANMWMSSYNSDSILMWTPASRAAGTQAADRGIGIAPTGGRAENIAFDSHGNLWITYCSSGSIVALSAAQQAASAGQVTPSVKVTATDLACAWAIAFDANGNAWVADPNNNLVMEFTTAQLSAGGAQTPAVEISDDGSGSLDGPFGLAFDAHGTLWVANGSDSVSGFLSNQLSASGSPHPGTRIQVDSASFVDGAAFDDRGTLWLADCDNDRLLALTSAQLSTGGSLTPSVMAQLPATTTGWCPEQIAFDPMATSPLLGPQRVRHGGAAMIRIAAVHRRETRNHPAR
jgi:sugar lactone lactonase YvrE